MNNEKYLHDLMKSEFVLVVAKYMGQRWAADEHDTFLHAFMPFLKIGARGSIVRAEGATSNSPVLLSETQWVGPLLQDVSIGHLVAP